MYMVVSVTKKIAWDIGFLCIVLQVQKHAKNLFFSKLDRASIQFINVIICPTTTIMSIFQKNPSMFD
jgi:hypothetical protein